jgi:rubrerythrin
MNSIKSTQTEQNLLKSFAGESQARNRYNFFAKQAKKEGFEQISAIFTDTANQEQQHANTFFRFLEGGDVEITASYPAGKIGTTSENLKAAALGENEEWTELYPEFAKVAKEEGLNEIANTFTQIAKVEKTHEDRYLKLLKNIEDGKVFKKDKKVVWKCRKCGFEHEGENAPQKCPACSHPQGYFEIKADNY